MHNEIADDVIGYGEAARLLATCRGTLYALVHQRRVPHFRIGRRFVRFSRAALTAWLEGHAVDPARTVSTGPDRGQGGPRG